ncbi:MAG: hypothetical protein AMXMBFR53_31740 [Gemmatimonadota bacterium]
MSRHPLNLLFRFLLEVAGLVAMGRWGWHLAPGWGGAALAVGVPAVGAAAWGVFRVQNDGGRPVVEVPGPVRLALEAAFFGAAVWLAARTGSGSWARPLGLAVLVHYAASWDRVALLARNRPLPAGGPKAAPGLGDSPPDR